MGMKLLYNDIEMAEVKDGEVIFINGPDLNEVINEKIGSIGEVEDDLGNIIYESTLPSLELKLAYMIGVLGFELEDGKKKINKKSLVKAQELDKSSPQNHKSLELESQLTEFYNQLEKNLLNNIKG
jgi:hypothetical protein